MPLCGAPGTVTHRHGAWRLAIAAFTDDCFRQSVNPCSLQSGLEISRALSDVLSR